MAWLRLTKGGKSQQSLPVWRSVSKSSGHRRNFSTRVYEDEELAAIEFLKTHQY